MMFLVSAALLGGLCESSWAHVFVADIKCMMDIIIESYKQTRKQENDYTVTSTHGKVPSGQNHRQHVMVLNVYDNALHSSPSCGRTMRQLIYVFNFVEIEQVD